MQSIHDSFHECVKVMFARLNELAEENIVYYAESLAKRAIKELSEKEVFQNMYSALKETAKKKGRQDLESYNEWIVKRALLKTVNPSRISQPENPRLKNAWQSIEECSILPGFGISTIAPVYWLELQDNSFQLDENIQFRKPTLIDLKRLQEHSDYFPYDITKPEVIVELIVKEEPPDPGKNAHEWMGKYAKGQGELFHLLEMCLRIFLPYKVHMRKLFIWAGGENWSYRQGFPMQYIDLSYAKPSGKYKGLFEQSSYITFTTFWKRYVQTMKIDRFSRAVSRYNRALMSERTGDAMSDLFVALESLFGGSKADVVFRASSLAGTSGESRFEIHNILGDCYKHRNTIMHGGSATKKMTDDLPKLIEMVRLCLYTCVYCNPKAISNDWAQILTKNLFESDNNKSLLEEEPT